MYTSHHEFDSMIDEFKKEILKLKNKKHVNKDFLQNFLERAYKGALSADENPIDHFCCCFLPFDSKSKKIFMGQHIKSQDLLSPGGHVKKNEQPIQTIKREFYEELKYKINKEKVELFDLAITDRIKDPRNCKIHYDLWYIVYIDKIDFDFDKGEFYNAKWLTIDEALKIMKRESFKDVIRKLPLSLVQ